MTVTVRKQKSPNAALVLEVDLGVRVVPLRSPGVTIAVGDVRQPSTPTGRYYVCVEAGVTGTREPRWHHDGQVLDGTVVWEPRELGHADLPTLSSVVYSAPNGIVLASQTLAGYRSSVTVSGGNPGAEFNVDLTVSASTGAIITVRYKIEVLQH